jgi:tetratricopeptide (TPR) repeat protein
LTFTAAEISYRNGAANALAALEGYVQRFPAGENVVTAYFYIAETYNARKDWPRALTAYEAVALKAPNTFAERSVLSAARINFFELKNYAKAEGFYAQLKSLTGTQETRLEAMRGLLRSQYQQQKWAEAAENAKELVAQKGSSADDKALSNMTIGKSAQLRGEYDVAMNAFRSVVAVNKAALAAEARYEIAVSWFALSRWADAEKAAFEVVNKSGSYDFWVTKAYILLGDVYTKQNDFFNAKATFQSIVENSLNAELKAEAQRKLDQVTEAEKSSSKLDNQ